MNSEKDFFIPKNENSDKPKEEVSNNILDQYSENPFETEMFRDAYDSVKNKRDLENKDDDAK